MYYVLKLEMVAAKVRRCTLDFAHNVWAERVGLKVKSALRKKLEMALHYPDSIAENVAADNVAADNAAWYDAEEALIYVIYN